MRQRNSSKSSISTSFDETKDEGEVQLPNRPASVMLALIGVIMYGAWSVFRYQYGVLPLPLTAEQAGKGGFSEFEAMEHVKALAGFGPHPVGFPALDGAIKYVADAAKKIKSTSHLEVDVEVEEFYVKNGVNRLKGGRFFGKSLIYADLNHIIIRISPKDAPDAKDNSILVSSHIDTVFTTGGAGDCSSCIAVMLELARGVSQWARGFKSSVIFLFNIGEEEGLNGAHSFITQHPWSETVRTAVDLEAMGIGGKSSIFQTGPNPWAIEIFASVAKYPSGNIFVQDLFSSGLVNSATDFQVYMEVAGLSGLDFAYSDKTAVYHTKNDKVELLKPGSFQHLGDNMLAFLCEAASSPALSKGDTHEVEENADQSAIYFDILGSYMVVYRQHFANMLHNSVLMPSVLIWIVFLVKGGLSAALSLALSCLSVILMWVLSLSFSVVVAFILPSISSAAVPFIASPWLVIGLFGFPSLLGAFAGQHLGFLLLKKYLCHIYAKEENAILPSSQLYLAKLEAERWLFKSGTIQWLFVLMLTHYYKLGSSYIPLVWLVTPLFSYGLLEALRLPKPLKFATLLIALSVPIVVTAGVIIRIIGVNIGTAVRYDSNPGSSAEWMGNVIVAVLIAAFVCLTMVFLLSYLHISGAKRSIVFVSGALFVLSLAAIWSGTIPSFTEETARAVNVVHVVDTRNGKEDLSSYVSFFSSTPGNLDREAQQIGEGFQCGRQKPIDFVTFSVQYGCWTNDTENGWSQSDIPEMEVKSDERVDERTTGISIDTKVSIRWALAINTDLIADFEVRATGDLQNLISFGDKDTKNGWHIIQFSGGRNAPTKFDLSLLWHKNSTDSSKRAGEEGEKYLLKLRTDMEKITPLTERVLMKLPSWCALFGKSTSPFSLAFLTGIPVDF